MKSMLSEIAKLNTQYLVDETGRKTAVVLNIDVFESLLEEIEDLALGKIADFLLAHEEETFSLEEVKEKFAKKDAHKKNDNK